MTKDVEDIVVYTDVVGPELVFTAPAPGSFLATNVPTLDLAFSDDAIGVDTATLAIQVGGNPLSVSCTFTLTTATCTPLSALPEDLLSLMATVADFEGNLSNQANLGFTIDTTPPTITATVDPEPSASGWHNTAVTISFDCQDATSGIGVCPPPRLYNGDGESQEIEATASDLAGNTATASILFSIDQVPPEISVTTVPEIQEWNSAMTVSFVANDSLSGIAEGSDPVVVTAEGQGQTITGSATDIAGNTSTENVTVNIDQTSPSLVITSHMSGETVLDPEITVSGTVSDTAAGVSSAGCGGNPGTLSGGNFECTVALMAGQNELTVTATDLAGNVSGSTVVLHFAPPPQVIIESPDNLFLSTSGVANVMGTTDDPNASVTVNGVSATVYAGAFAADVPLATGVNTITAVAETL